MHTTTGLCCPEFAAAFLGKFVPYKKLNTTAEAYTNKLSLCRVPIYGMPAALATCSSSSSSGGSSGVLFRTAGSGNTSVLAQQGPVDELDPNSPLTGGGASRSGGSYQPTPFFLVAGASRIYDAALTGGLVLFGMVPYCTHLAACAVSVCSGLEMHYWDLKMKLASGKKGRSA